MLLPEGKGFGTAELDTLLFYAAKASFTCNGMLLRTHLDIILWVASISMILEKRAVPSIKDIHLWVGK